jgi:hypothetical protein
MRGALHEQLKWFAESKGYGFATDIVPTGLLNEKYPCIFFVAPDTTYDAVKRRWTYPSTFYVVAPKTKGKSVDSILDDLQTLCRDLFLFLQKDSPLDYFVDKTMNCSPKAGFDNSGAVGMEMKLNIYEADGCR